MNTIINDCLMVLNDIGQSFCNYAGNVFIQSSVLIILLLLVDFMVRKRVRAVFRYWMWMLVFVKLILPPTLSLPIGIGHWCGDYLSADSVLKQTAAISQEASTATPIVLDVPETSGVPLTQEITKPADMAKSQDTLKTAEIPLIRSSEAKIEEKATPVLPDRTILSPITWQAVAFSFWLVGVLVISVLLIQRILFVRGLIAQGEAADEDLVEMMSQCRQKVGVTQNIEIRLSNTIMSPAVCGLFRPIVLMPKSLLDALSPENLKAVLVHELAHIKRGDLWINCVQTILQIIYFYNPFVWFANAVVRKIREQAVDEMVLVALGAEAKSYSNTLIDIAEIAFFRASLSLRLIGVVESKKELSRRIRHMLNRPIPKSAKIGLWGLFVVMAMGAVLLPMAKAQVGEEMKIASNGVPAAMVGTWFFNNPQGDEEQMAVFPDGRVVVLYSNGHKDRTKYIDGFVELAEYGDARCKMVIREDGTLVQYFTHSEGEKFTKQWKRIDPIPKTNLLRSLTGRDTAKVQGMSTSEPALVFEPIDSQAKTKLLKQIEDMTKGMIEAFNEGNVGILLSYFTDDAIVLPDQLEAAIGQDALRRHYLQQMEQQVKIRSLKDIESQIWICGDYVFEVGNFVASITSPELRFMLSDWQKNLAVYKKQPDGSLKMKLTASNPTQIPEDGNIPEAIEPEAVKVISSRRPSSLPLNVSEQIKESESVFHKKFLERDAEGAVEFYAEDAVLLRWGEDALKGKSEILKVIKKSLREEPLVDMIQEVVHVEGNSQMLFVVNLLTWTFKDASSGENVTLPGKGVHVWTHQKDGSWKILFDLYNVNVPIPGR